MKFADFKGHASRCSYTDSLDKFDFVPLGEGDGGDSCWLGVSENWEENT